MTAKGKELYKKVIALDPEGKAGSYTDDYLKAQIPYTQGAEYELGQASAFDRKPDPAPLQAFIKKYPTSALVKNAYSYLAYYYGSQAPKAEATKFFEEYTAKYPEDRNVIGSYVERIIKDKEPVDKGLALAEKLKDLAGYPENPSYQKDLAQLYVLKGDPVQAEEVYGKDFIDDYVATAYYALVGYMNFWLDQDKNLDSVEAMADMALKVRPDEWYTYSQVAGVYARLKKPEKALAVFGPEFAKKHWDDQSVLSSYAGFWNRQGTNLPSAVEAARRSVVLTNDYSNNFILGQLLFKLKDYSEALKAAEKAVELVKPMAAKYEGFPVQQYENLVKQIKEAIAKGGEVKK
jgi:tetratricopeptide (TPR) repeat protein